MFDIFIEKLKRVLDNRTIPTLIVFLAVFLLLGAKTFHLQIVGGEENGNYTETTKKTEQRDIKSTRGNFYDRNGVQLSENVLSYSVVMSNTALVTDNSKKNKMILDLITLLEHYGYGLELDFGIDLVKTETESGTEYSLEFNVKDNAELRFKKNAYCLTSVKKLTESQRNATAEDVFAFLRYGDRENGKMFEIDESYTMEEAYKIMVVRYNLLILNPQYSQFTLASNYD